MTYMAEGSGSRIEQYSGFSRFLHWVVAICVIVMIPIGIAMTRVGPGDLQNAFFTIHRSLGVLVLGLMIIRLLNRLIAGAPPPEPSLTSIQRAVSHVVHMALYALLIAQGLIGWVATSAYGATISFFGVFAVPNLVSKDQALSEPLFAAHFFIGLTVTALILLHIAAALYHGFVRRDGVLQRMLP